jgi:hypothetical protein
VEKGGMDINISTKVLEFPHVVQYSIVDGQLVSCHFYIFLVAIMDRQFGILSFKKKLLLVIFSTKYYPQMPS